MTQPYKGGGSQLRSYRLAKGLTQKSAAKKLGCGKLWIYRIENGHGTPSLEMFFKISTLYGLNDVEFITLLYQFA